jgi:P22 coat protein - gene protein 5
MATLPNNTLQTVQTYQKAELAWMLNEFVAINISNKKFKDFNSLTANLGDTVTFDLAPRSFSQNGLVVALQQSQQRVQSLTCSQAANTSSAYTDQQFIFNVEDYMDRFGMSRIKELGNSVESDVLKNIVSGVRVNNPQDPAFGTILDPASGPYRFFGNGVTAINSFQQLAQAEANFRDYGAATDRMCAIIPLVDVPAIVQNGLSQFALTRNNDLAETWQFAQVGQFEWYQSNLLPIHVSGTVGNNSTVLTLVSTNDPTGNNITQLTFSGATSLDPNAFFAGDLFEFNDGVGSLPNLRYLTFIGHQPSAQPVQVRVTAPAAADISGNVTVSIYPALQSTPGLNQNLNTSLQAGMQITTLPTHRAGVIMSGNPLYLAMPQLPDESPFDTVRTTDPDSGCSLRHYWGSQFGQNVRAYVWDVIWGSTLVAENSMRVCFPL